MYIDNWFIHSPSKESAATSISVALRILADTGFKVNLEKCDLTPMQKLPWLGIEWGSVNGSDSRQHSSNAPHRSKS